MTPEQPDDDNDDVALYQQRRIEGQLKRAANRQQSAQILKRAGVAFVTRNMGAHLTVTHGERSVDFWPGTGMWIDRSGPKGRGVFKLLKHLGVSACRTTD